MYKALNDYLSVYFSKGIAYQFPPFTVLQFRFHSFAGSRPPPKICDLRQLFFYLTIVRCGGSGGQEGCSGFAWAHSCNCV